MNNGVKAVKLLFWKAQKEYLNLFQEMVDQEKEEGTLLKAFGNKKPNNDDTIYNTFTKKSAIQKNADLYRDTEKILGKQKVIKSHENMFFDILFYKFCEDWKQYHPNEQL